MSKTKLLAFRLTPAEKSKVDTIAKLRGLTTSDIFRNYALALIAGDPEAKIHSPRGKVVAYK